VSVEGGGGRGGLGSTDEGEEVGEEGGPLVGVGTEEEERKGM
jgi:hypothetical protein